MEMYLEKRVFRGLWLLAASDVVKFDPFVVSLGVLLTWKDLRTQRSDVSDLLGLFYAVLFIASEAGTGRLGSVGDGPVVGRVLRDQTVLVCL